MRPSRIVALVALVAAVSVPAARALDFTDESALTPRGIVGTPYSFQFTANEGCLPYHYTIINGNFPPGLTLSDSGAVSGTPTEAGKFDFWLELFDTAGATCTVSRSQQPFAIEVLEQMLVSTPSLHSAELNAPYESSLAVDQATPVIWSLESGALPTGLQLSEQGVISGTPTAPGSFSFVVQAKDTTSNRVATKSFTVEVVTPLTVTAPPLPKAEVGKPLAPIAPSASGGLTSSPYSWSLGSGSLPGGLTLDPASGAIAGTPAAAGSFPLRLVVSDAEGRAASVDLTLVVAKKLSIAARRLPAAKVRRVYRARLVISGGVAPIRWRLVDGSLPRGLGLAARKGVIVGTPRRAGSQRFTLHATDALGVTSTRSFVLKVVAVR
jgi:hypothetical protein